MEQKRMEIRCCCDCSLIGTVPDRGFKIGEHYKLPLARSGPGPELRIEGPTAGARDLDFECATYADGKIVRVVLDKIGPFALFGIDVGPIERKVALKSKDYPIEQIRLIPGFVEASDADRKQDEGQRIPIAEQPRA